MIHLLVGVVPQNSSTDNTLRESGAALNHCNVAIDKLSKSCPAAAQAAENKQKIAILLYLCFAQPQFHLILSPLG